MVSGPVLLGIKECKMCFALGKVQGKVRWTGELGNVMHIYNQACALTRLSSSVLYPNAAFRNHHSHRNHFHRRNHRVLRLPVEFFSTSGLLPSQVAEKAIIPTMHHVRVKPEPCSLLAYGWNGVMSWRRGLNSGGHSLVSASETGIIERYCIWLLWNGDSV